MTEATDPEASYLELCERHEGLRRECPGQAFHGVRDEIVVVHEHCCQGRGWLPKPEAERLGALVEVVRYATVWFDEDSKHWRAEVWGDPYHSAPKPWQALTAALAAAEAPHAR